jgi:hypothetical protein
MNMKQLSKDDFKIPALLLTMSLVPALGGVARLASLSGGRGFSLRPGRCSLVEL